MKWLQQDYSLFKVGMTRPIPSSMPHGFGLWPHGLALWPDHSAIWSKASAAPQHMKATKPSCQCWPYRDDLLMSRKGPEDFIFPCTASKCADSRSLIPDGLCICESNTITPNNDPIPLKVRTNYRKANRMQLESSQARAANSRNVNAIHALIASIHTERRRWKPHSQRSQCGLLDRFKQPSNRDKNVTHLLLP